MEDLNKKLLEVYKFVSDNYKSNANDIFYSMEFLIESVRDTKNSILKSVKKTNDFNEIYGLLDYGKSIEEIEGILSAYLNAFTTMSTTEEREDIIEEESIDNEKTIPNYKDYEVDAEIPHLLTESFTHKKICGFFLNNVRYNVADWKTTLVKICELLYDKDPDLFQNVIVSNRFTGSKIEYFSTSNKGKYYRKLKNANIYVWTCHSANAICSLIRRLLLEYNIPSNSLYIYLRADYTPLHSGVENIEVITHPDVSEDIKIGKFVRSTMRNLSIVGYMFDKQMLISLLNDEDTKKMFGIGISFFKEVKDETQISKLTKDAKGYNRYWREIFEFNGRKFLIVSQWTNSNKDRFYRWYNTLEGIKLWKI